MYLKFRFFRVVLMKRKKIPLSFSGQAFVGRFSLECERITFQFSFFQARLSVITKRRNPIPEIFLQLENQRLFTFSSLLIAGQKFSARSRL